MVCQAEQPTEVDFLVVMHRQLAAMAASLCPSGCAVEGTSSSDHVAAWRGIACTCVHAEILPCK